jgi:hypothetical protein
MARRMIPPFQGFEWGQINYRHHTPLGSAPKYVT